MFIDCQTCPARGHRCGDCMFTALLATSPPQASDGTLPLDRQERAAVGAFVGAGLIGASRASTLRATPTPDGTHRYGAVG